MNFYIVVKDDKVVYVVSYLLKLQLNLVPSLVANTDVMQESTLSLLFAQQQKVLIAQHQILLP